uniref:HCLS1-binding protein 3 n=1 Tax=Rhinopithecus bieti TaxID=61621 RepID=A0A2K6KWC8_RHIBE
MHSPAVLVTSRRLQNAHTGLDLTVPQHQEVRGKMMSGHVEYQILVVTRLAAFKSAKHRPEDVVQFLVSKKYSEIEEFYQKLSSRYAAASLPPLPRKVLFVGESDIRERRAVFNEILRCVSKDAELAGSPELLEFLGTRGSAPCPSGLPRPELGSAALWEHVHSCLCSLEVSARLVRQVASLTSLAGWAEGGLPLRA